MYMNNNIFYLMLVFTSFNLQGVLATNPLLTCGETNAEIGTLDKIHLIPPFYAKNGLSTGADINNHYLWLSTPETTPFEVTIQNADGFNGANNGIHQTVTIDKDNPVLITLSAGVYGSANYGALGIVNDSGVNTINSTDGLILTANNRFYANIRHHSNSQGGSLTAKGQVAMGTRFRTGHMHMDGSGGSDRKSHFISVMASEDSTTVNFSDISPGITFVGGTPTSVLLDKYESYVVGVRMDIADNSAVANDLNGTLVTSDKGVVINTGSFLGGSIPNSGSRDLGADQILPTKFNGTQFIVVKGAAESNADLLENPIIVADEDSTEIFLKGSSSPIATIDAGDYYIISGNEYPANGAMFIRTSNPAYVYQTTNANNSNGNGLNFIAPILPNLEAQELLLPNAGQLGTAIIYIVAPSTAMVTVDGNPVTDGVNVPGITDFLLYTITGKSGDVNINSTEPYFISMTTVSGVRGSAGFFVGFPNSYAVRDNATALPTTATVIDVKANDVEGIYAFSLDTICQQPANGTVTINPDETVTYTPNPGFFGIDTFQYHIISTQGLSDVTYVYVAIDSDGDGVGDIVDIDIDNDGIPNVHEQGDTDDDGIDNEYDLDSDNDGIFDVLEAGHGAIDADNDGRLDGFAGTNGLVDAVETVAESSLLNYSFSDSETSPDGLYDFWEIDADGDTCPDTKEANVADSDHNGIAGTSPVSVNSTGLVMGIVYSPPSNINWQNATLDNCNEAPSFTSSNNANFIENTIGIVLNIQSIDDFDSEGSGLFFSITNDSLNSPDHTHFNINAVTGELTFSIISPNYENPIDTDSNNIYQLEVQVCDSESLCTTEIISITVVDEDEDGDGFTGQNEPDDTNPCVPSNAASPCCEAQAPIISKD